MPKCPLATARPECRLCTDLIALFCPVYYPNEDMILLEQCDKPSVFQVRPGQGRAGQGRLGPPR